MNARYRPVRRKARPKFVHTLNGSGLAVGRALSLCWKTTSNADGSIKVPTALVPYMGGVEVISR
jgi:seryl-tRNA synthetase